MADESGDRDVSGAIDIIHSYYLDIESRIIYLHSELDEEEVGVDFRMAATFIKNLDYLNSISNEPITVKMMSYGGCWNYGMAIYDAIRTSPSEITMISSAHSRSMSSIIPQAAKYRKIHKHCDFMIHYGTYADDGEHRAVMNAMKYSEKSSKVMIDIYVDRCINGQFAKDKNLDRAKLYKFIKSKMDKLTDWWLSAEDAVYYGFMDEVL